MRGVRSGDGRSRELAVWVRGIKCQDWGWEVIRGRSRVERAYELGVGMRGHKCHVGIGDVSVRSGVGRA